MFPALPRPNYVNEADGKCYEPISIGRMTEKWRRLGSGEVKNGAQDGRIRFWRAGWMHGE